MIVDEQPEKNVDMIYVLHKRHSEWLKSPRAMHVGSGAESVRISTSAYVYRLTFSHRK